MCVKILLICWFDKNILARVPCNLHIGVKIMLIRWFAKKFLAGQVFLTRCASKSCWSVDSPKISLRVFLAIYIYRCQNLADSLIRQKISCKAKFFSPDVCQNLVDLLIRQKYPCEGSLQSTYIGVKILPVCSHKHVDSNIPDSLHKKKQFTLQGQNL